MPESGAGGGGTFGTQLAGELLLLEMFVLFASKLDRYEVADMGGRSNSEPREEKVAGAGGKLLAGIVFGEDGSRVTAGDRGGGGSAITASLSGSVEVWGAGGGGGNCESIVARGACKKKKKKN